MKAVGDFFKRIGGWVMLALMGAAGLLAFLWRAAVRREKVATKRADDADERADSAGRALERTIKVETREEEIQREARTQKELAAEKLARELKAIDAIGEAAINNPDDLDQLIAEGNRRLEERRKAGKP